MKVELRLNEIEILAETRLEDEVMARFSGKANILKCRAIFISERGTKWVITKEEDKK